MNSNKQNLINKIKYRSKYRGTKEMDIFVKSFVNKVINDLSFDDLEQLGKLVNLSDEKIIEISTGNTKNSISKKISRLLIDHKENK